MSKIDYSMNEFVDELCEEATIEINNQIKILKENLVEDDVLNADLNIMSIAALSIGIEMVLFRKVLEDMGVDTDELVERYIPDIDEETAKEILRS